MMEGSHLLTSLLKGAGTTIELTLLASLLAFVIAVIGGIGRSSRYRAVRYLATAYIEFFRGTSLLVQLIWLYYVFPVFLGISLPKFTAAVLALALNYGAYGAEVVRGALASIPKGQTEAAIALNMTPWQGLRCVIFPQALIMMLPPMGNLLIELLKGTSLVSLITIADMTYEAQLLRTGSISDTPLIYTLLLLFYFAFAMLLTTGMRMLEKRLKAGRV